MIALHRLNCFHIYTAVLPFYTIERAYQKTLGQKRWRKWTFCVRWKEAPVLFVAKTNRKCIFPPLCTSIRSLCGRWGKWVKSVMHWTLQRQRRFCCTSDMTANNYSVFRKTWKWAKKRLFFHLVNLTVLNAFIIHCSRGGTLSHELFCDHLVSGLIHAAQDRNPTPAVSGRGRPPFWFPSL